MTPLVTAEVATSETGVYRVDLLHDEQGGDPNAAGWTPWDRVTYEPGPFGQGFAEVALVEPPEVPFGQLDLNTGLPVLPSSCTATFEDPDGGLRQLLAGYDPATLFLRYRSVAVGAYGGLDWFGRVVSSSRAKPLRRATRDGRVTVESACGLTPRLKAPSEPTADVPVGDLVARLCFHANPHLPLRIALDVAADGQYADGDGYTSSRHLRASDEWAGKAFVAEGSGEAAEDAEGDYGDRREVLDKLADSSRLRVFQHPGIGEWWAVPESAVGEAIPGAERAVYAPAADGGPTWDAPGVSPIAADAYDPLDDDVRDAEADLVDVVERLAAVTLQTGAANLVPPAYRTGLLHEGESDEVALLILAADPAVRVNFYVVGDSGAGVAIRLDGLETGSTYYLQSDFTWGAAFHEFVTGAAGGTAAAVVPETSRIVLERHGSTDGLGLASAYNDVSVSLERASDGEPVTSWRITAGDPDGPGEVAEAEQTPGTEHDTTGAGDWATTDDYVSARWGSSSVVLAAYGAEAALRRRAEDLDAIDGALWGLHGPARRITLALDDADAAAFVVGAGCTLKPGEGLTDGVWPRLPSLSEAV